jgi:hypothetical protein
MRRRKAAAGTALVLALAMTVGGCSGDGESGAAKHGGRLTKTPDSGGVSASGDSGSGDSGADDAGGEAPRSRDAYVDALGGAVGLSDAEAVCVFGAVVDAVGLEQLERSGLFDVLETQGGLDAPLSAYGIALDDEQVAALGADIDACIDLRLILEEMITAEGSSPELAACLTAGITDDTLQRVVVLIIMEGVAGLAADPELGPDISTVGAECAAQGVS